jgi:hypothetical protein
LKFSSLFYLFLWVIFALLDPDLDQADQNQCGCGSETLLLSIKDITFMKLSPKELTTFIAKHLSRRCSSFLNKNLGREDGTRRKRMGKRSPNHKLRVSDSVMYQLGGGGGCCCLGHFLGGKKTSLIYFDFTEPKVKRIKKSISLTISLFS